jgi:hypothetical protein
MSEVTWQEEIGRRVVIGQIIVAALVIGCLFFLGIVLLLKPPAVAAGAQLPNHLLTMIAMVFVLLAIGARLIIPSVIVASARQSILKGTSPAPGTRAGDEKLAEFLDRTGDAGRLWLAYLTRTIVGAAILEGTAFYCLITYMIERTPLALGLALGLIAALAMHLPTRSRVIHWIEDQLRILEQQRQFRG